MHFGASARRRAPSGCGSQARRLRCSLLTYHPGYARRSRLASGPGGQQQNVSVIPSQTLIHQFIFDAVQNAIYKLGGFLGRKLSCNLERLVDYHGFRSLAAR